MLRCANGYPILSYGKSCIVGTLGEYEHGNACLTTSFADPIREAIGGGVAWIPSTGKIGGPGTEIDIPFAHKDAIYARSFYDTLTISILLGGSIVVASGVFAAWRTRIKSKKN